jgi:transmembrane sensor
MTGPDPTNLMRDRATEWFVRSQTPEFSPADWRGLHAWLAEDAAHADAYAEVEALWVDFEDATETLQAEVVPFQPRAARKPRIGPVWYAGTAAAAAAVIVVVATGVLRNPAPTPAPLQAATYATQPGERREVTLQDGSHLTLNGGTRIEVSLGGAERHVTLASGEAAFDVAHDKTHPFVIDLGERQVTVVGTEFNILKQPAKLIVTVRQGVVAVVASAKDAHPVLLTAGRQLTHRTGEADSTVRTVDPSAAYGWRSGRLSYDGAPLSEVADDLGRYFGKTVAVDPDVSALPFTGVLTLDEERAVFTRLEMFVPIKAQVSASGVRLARGASR